MTKYIIILLVLMPFAMVSQMESVFYIYDDDYVSKDNNFENQIKEILKIDKNIELDKVEQLSFEDELGHKHKTYRQKIDGINVEFSTIKIHFKSDMVNVINGDYVTSIRRGDAKISESQAYGYLQENLKLIEKGFDDYSKSATASEITQKGELVYLPMKDSDQDQKIFLAYKYEVINLELPFHYWMYISANSGELIYKLSRICKVNGTGETKYSGTRTISTTEISSNEFKLIESGTSRCPIETTVDDEHLIDDDNNWTATEYNDVELRQVAIDIHWAAEMYYDYFKSTFNRNSIDNMGHILKSNYRTRKRDQAYWMDGQIILHRGEDIYETTASLDIVAHEFAHGFCEKTCDLKYDGESASLNEGLSDIWAVCVENYADQTKTKWKIGEEVTLLNDCLRNISDPKLRNSADTYLGQYWSPGNVIPHNNGTVLSYWFYLLSEGGIGVNDNSDSYNVSGIGLESAAQIVYRAETTYFTPLTTFSTVRNRTLMAVEDIFGKCSQQYESAINAWYAVGIGSSVEQKNSLYIDTDVEENMHSSKYAYSLIEASNILKSNSYVRYNSSKKIVLKPGFHTLSSCDFAAKIVPCSDIKSLVSMSELNHKKIRISEYNYEHLDIYPNPFSENFSLAVGTLNNQKNNYVQVLNINGDVVLEQQILFPNLSLNLSHVRSGVYFVVVVKGEEKISSKIIKY